MRCAAPSFHLPHLRAWGEQSYETQRRKQRYHLLSLTRAQQCQRMIGHLLPLDSQLIKPVQRILKYRLFLEVRTHELLSFVKFGIDQQ